MCVSIILQQMKTPHEVASPSSNCSNNELTNTVENGNEFEVVRKDLMALSNQLVNCQQLLAEKDVLIGQLQNQTLQSRSSSKAKLSDLLTQFLNPNESRLISHVTQLISLREEKAINFNHELPDKLATILKELLFEFWPKFELLMAGEACQPPEVTKPNLDVDKLGCYDAIVSLVTLCVGELASEQFDEQPELVERAVVELIEENSSLKLELDSSKRARQKEEEQIFKLVQAISEAEMELELLGRRTSTYKDAISSFIKATCSNTGTSYSSSLTKLILHIYSNQLNHYENVQAANCGAGSSGETYKMSLNYNLWQNDEEQEQEEEFDYEQPIADLGEYGYQINGDHRQLTEEEVVRRGQESDKFEKHLQEVLDTEEVDEKKVNYILLRPYSGSSRIALQSGLEVVNEEDELEAEDEDDGQSFDQDGDSLMEDNSGRSLEVRELVDDMVSFIELVELHDELDGHEEAANSQVPSDKTFVQIVMESTSPVEIERRRKRSFDSPIELEPYPSSNFQSETDKHLSLPSQDHELQNKVLEQSKQCEQLQAELEGALAKIKDLEEDGERRVRHKRSASLDDELVAWQELVDQQKALLGKVTEELDETQSKLKVTENELNLLKSPTKLIVSSFTQTDAVPVDDCEQVTIEPLELSVSESNYDLGSLVSGQYKSFLPSDDGEEDADDQDTINGDNEELKHSLQVPLLTSGQESGSDRNNNLNSSSPNVASGDPLKLIESDVREIKVLMRSLLFLFRSNLSNINQL